METKMMTAEQIADEIAGITKIVPHNFVDAVSKAEKKYGKDGCMRR
jgi:hypothetical protein